jgi:hypothetical protein
MLFVVIASACSQSARREASDQEAIGVISAQLELGSIPIDDVSWTLYGPAYLSGVFHVAGSGASFTGVVPGVPEGSYYSFSLSATSTSGPVTSCFGSANGFVVNRGSRVNLKIHMLCQGQTDRSGMVGVQADVNVCPTADSISVPSTVTVGEPIALEGAAHDEDEGPSPLGLTWTTGAGEGEFDDAHAATPQFTCLLAGQHAITLTVSDGDPNCAASYPGDVALTVPIDCSDPDQTPAVSAQMP